MKQYFAITALGLFVLTAAALSADRSSSPRPTCAKQDPSEPLLYSNDFRWDYTLPEMRTRFEEIYSSGKRLKQRAYFDRARGAYVMEYGTYASGSETWRPVVLSQRFLKSITRHIEIALERRYADAVFFPDMGHSHFFYPEAMKEVIQRFPVEEKDRMYQALVDMPSLRILYHTAEQLQMTTERHGTTLVEDKEIQWRYFSRNVIGDVQGGENTAPHYAFGERFNTLGKLEGNEYFGGGFNISASKDGCFAYRHKGNTYHFDLSWYDLESSDPVADSY